jgi:hypothetical protein
MGPAGSGKSSVSSLPTNDSHIIITQLSIQFIAAASGEDCGVNHSLACVASGIKTIRTTNPKDLRPVVFVDTPGFDDTCKSETEILGIIAEWLVEV